MVVVSVFAFAFFHLFIPMTSAQTEEEMIDIIVTYNDGVPNNKELSKNYHVEKYENERNLHNLSMKIVTVPTTEMEKFKKDPNVKSVSINQNYTIDIAEENPQATINETNLEMIGANDAHRHKLTGDNVKIAILDTGFAKHDDYQIKEGFSAINENEEENSNTEEYDVDYEGHGTHVAGIIGSSTYGVAPDADLYGAKVFEYDETKGKIKGNSIDLIQAISWAIEKEVDIINMSLGTPTEDEAVHEAIVKAYEEGILLVAASGNNGGAVEYPAAFEEVIAVSAVESDQRFASFSATGPENELTAPGVNITSLSTENSYTQNSGTSQATPHVTGILAILKQKLPNHSATELRELAQNLANDLGPQGRDSEYGFGLVHYSDKPPVITYEGEKHTLTIPVGEPFDFPEITATDDFDEKVPVENLLTNNATGEEIKWEEFSKSPAIGEYTLQATAVDSVKNTDRLVLNIIVKQDTEAPMITGVEEDQKTLAYGDKFTFPEVQAVDNIDENVELLLTIKNSDGETIEKNAFSTKKPGEYQFLYQATDDEGNFSEHLIKVTILPEEMKEDNQTVEPIVNNKEEESANAEPTSNQPENDADVVKSERERNIADNKESQMNELPDTSSFFGNFILAGLALLLVGLVLIRRKKRTL